MTIRITGHYMDTLFIEIAKEDENDNKNNKGSTKQGASKDRR